MSVFHNIQVVASIDHKIASEILAKRFYKAHKPALMKNPTRFSNAFQLMKSQESKYKFLEKI